MDSFITFCKENNQLITLLIGLLGVIIAAITLIHELNTRNRR